MTETNNLLVSINNRIDAIRASEKITKVELGAISRELLFYIPESKDIDACNRLIGVLTPMNKTTAILFFTAFLPWAWDEKNERFAAMVKGAKSVEGKFNLVTEFLSHEENNIWLWAQRNIKIELNKTPFTERLTALTAKALKGEKGLDPIAKSDVIAAIMAGGISAGDLINMMEEAKKAFEERTALEAAAAAEQIKE